AGGSDTPDSERSPLNVLQIDAYGGSRVGLLALNSLEQRLRRLKDLGIMVSLSRGQLFLADPSAALGAGIGFELVAGHLGILPGDQGFERSIAVLDSLLRDGFEPGRSAQRECSDDSRDRFHLTGSFFMNKQRAVSHGLEHHTVYIWESD